jgi:menaquinone-dependent protoporphyrinogen oxidase
MKVLVSAASKHEATAEIARAIAASLSDAGVETTVLPPGEVTTLDGYDAVILGSAVYMGRWMSEARDLVDRLSGPLTGRPVWLFSSGPVGDSPKRQEEAADVPAMLAATGARGHTTFGGRIVLEDLGLGSRIITAVLHVPDGDHRDWAQITAWSQGIARELLQGSARLSDGRTGR